jgi:PadR family transcriptional regulator, regulatory protein AphA
MNREIQLTPTSHIVLGLLSMLGEATPYDLKRMVSASVGHFWSLPHSQLYAEPARLARAGYMTEHRQQDGRRRKLYALTDRGREALEDWLRVPAPEPYELRDLATLKLFFGADPRELAEVQLETHRRKLAEYEALREQDTRHDLHGPRLALDHGTRHERETIRFWSEHARPSNDKPPRHPRRSARS